jgi:hypothetical protein
VKTQLLRMHHQTVEVDKVSFQTLVTRYNIGSVGFLKTDTEGHDCTIMRSLLTAIRQGNLFPPAKIQFETNELADPRQVEEVVLQVISADSIFVVLHRANEM